MATESNNTLSEISSEVKAAVASRLRNPFLGVFTLSWIAWNHRLLFVLFSDGKVAERFSYIDKHLYPTVDAFAWLNLIGPSISTLIYVAAVPWLAEKALVLNLWYQRRQKAAELRSEGLELLTHQQSVQLREIVSVRDKTIKEINHQLLVQQRRVARFEAVAAVSNGTSPESLWKIHQKYWVLELFSEKTHFSSGSQAIIKFDESGYVHVKSGGPSSNAFDGVERWAQKKDGFVFHSHSGDEVGRMSFDANMAGFFTGSVNGVERLLVAHTT
ncbi:hypothetical protein [Xanthomonas arboricola]|uniref:hypothetical protein n=1 Tax=Xanthomonas arboricola TaxID=56448 RepID=UPI0011B01872|nr:hypothetical protein [Xanthomonas arboricola]MBB6573536.1 hypothetical protein [Xanthomonas arboricola]